LSLFLLLLTVVALFLNTGSPEPQVGDISSEMDRFNSMVSDIKDLRAPNVVHGPLKTSVEYKKKTAIRLDSSLGGRTEMKAAADRNTFWFWCRSFDRSSVYYCDRSRINETRLKPAFHPCLAAAMFCVDEIEKSTVIDTPDGRRIATEEDGFNREIELHNGLIVRQQFRVGNKLVATMKVEEFQKHREFTLPSKIRITWHDEGISATISMGDIIINSGVVPDTSIPTELSRVNLENF
jgi:hypothetical protein